jgi:hypothetical protein
LQVHSFSLALLCLLLSSSKAFLAFISLCLLFCASTSGRGLPS